VSTVHDITAIGPRFWRSWLIWMLGFLAFPIAGVAASVIAGRAHPAIMDVR
jgi:hypothetical protein